MIEYDTAVIKDHESSSELCPREKVVITITGLPYGTGNYIAHSFSAFMIAFNGLIGDK